VTTLQLPDGTASARKQARDSAGVIFHAANIIELYGGDKALVERVYSAGLELYDLGTPK
jgi:phytoene/squalene synthetase